MDDPYRYFRVEARELLDGLVHGAVELEQGAPPAAVAPALLRIAHTLKGAARIVRQPEIADHAHGIEEILGPRRDSDVPLDREHLGFLFSLLDEIRGRVDQLDQPDKPDGPGAAPTTATSGASPATAGASPTTPDGAPSPANAANHSVRTDLGDVDILLDNVSEAHARLSGVRDRLDRVAHARELLDAITARLPDGPTRPLGEQLRQVLADLHQGLDEGVGHVDRELQQVRDAAERLRLVPVATLLRSLELAARDVARAQSKAVTFTAEGGDLRFDAHLVTTVQAALEQIVRNAVAHGIEPPDERRQTGKPPEGVVTVAVSRRGPRAVFSCHDDGRGIDVVAVREVARARGLLATGDDELSSEALLRLLLTGGLSTSGVVTELSGRGIGLDIARDAVERLGGEIRAWTEAGRGTTIEVDVPLSLSSLSALAVQADGRAALLPLDAVRRIVRVHPGELVAAGSVRTLVLEGASVPFVPLATLLTGTPTPDPDGAWSAVIVESPDGTAAVGVHRSMARASVVVRPLPELTPRSPLVAGVALDNQGDAELVLDPPGVVAAATRPVTAPSTESARAPILVVDDSLTTRMLEQTILESAGYDVDVAVSGEDALEQVERRRYGLLLVDVEMPGIDGFTFVERLRAHPTLGDTPCIFVTSRATTEDLLRSAELGARAHIVKSQFDQQALLAHIREVVGG